MGLHYTLNEHDSAVHELYDEWGKFVLLRGNERTSMPWTYINALNVQLGGIKVQLTIEIKSF